MGNSHPGVRVLPQTIAGGALDHYLVLKSLVAEGGAARVPATNDRVVVLFRQCKTSVRTELSRLRGDIVRHQVDASSQRVRSGVQIIGGTHCRKVFWDNDYPHLEDAYGHAQGTSRPLVAGVGTETQDQALAEASTELFGTLSSRQPRKPSPCRKSLQLSAWIA